MKNNNLNIIGYALLVAIVEVIRICLILPFLTFVFFYSLDNILTNIDLGVTKVNYFYYLSFSFVVYVTLFRKMHKKEED